jgi:hypothetical protein
MGGGGGAGGYKPFTVKGLACYEMLHSAYGCTGMAKTTIIDLNSRVWERGLHSCSSEHDPVAGSSEQHNEPSSLVK